MMAMMVSRKSSDGDGEGDVQLDVWVVVMSMLMLMYDKELNAFKSVVEGLMTVSVMCVRVMVKSMAMMVPVVSSMKIMVTLMTMRMMSLTSLTVGSAMQAFIGSRSSSCCAVELFFNISTICSNTVRFIVWITSTEAFTFFTLFRILSHFVRGHFLSMSLRFALIFS